MTVSAQGAATATATAVESSVRSRPLKVLHVGKFYPPHMGGIETHLQVLARGLRNSLDLRVLVASDNNQTVREVVEDVPVVRVSTALTMASAPICPAMVSEIRGSDADIVHIHLSTDQFGMANFRDRGT